VARLAARLADRRLTLELTPAAKAWLADRGYDPAYGARPLRRLVSKAIGDELARRLLGGELAEGDAILVDAEDDKLTFTRRQPAAVA
jgi:ATP-dependent Clp protease ATP-binding subunit ClpB